MTCTLLVDGVVTSFRLDAAILMLNLEVVLDSTFSGGRDFLEIPNLNPSLAMPILFWRTPWLVMTGFT